VRKYRVYRLCPTCWREIVPEHPPDYAAKAEDTEAIAANQRYWAWRWEIDKRHARGQATHRNAPRDPDPPPGNYNPHCQQCGALTEEYDFSPTHSLFGKSRHYLCPVCEARETVETVWKWHDKVHPDWNAEQWLVLLRRAFPQAFAVGVLPDYWHALAGPGPVCCL
jgi:hypothetical protein